MKTTRHFKALPSWIRRALESARRCKAPAPSKAALHRRERREEAELPVLMEQAVSLVAAQAAILEASPDFVARAEPDGRATYINRAGRRLVGLSDDADVSQTRVFDQAPAWARQIIREQGLPAAIRDGVWEGETALLHRDGREIPVSQVILAHRSADGTIEYLSTIARDLGERKALEAQLRQAQKMEATARLASGIAHDFNNLLNVITGYGELMLKRLAPEAPERKRLEQILKAADRAAVLTRQLLAFSREQVPQLRVLSFDARVDEPLELPTPSPPSPARTRGRETILVVEDEEMVREMLCEALGMEGYVVLSARDGEEAVAVAARAEGPIDLLLTDLILPKMGGRHLAARLAVIRPALRVLYMSGYPSESAPHPGLPEEAFLQKPFTAQELTQKVRGVLDARESPWS